MSFQRQPVEGAVEVGQAVREHAAFVVHLQRVEFEAVAAHGKGVAEALGLSLEEALIAEDPAHPEWDDR